MNQRRTQALRVARTAHLRPERELVEPGRWVTLGDPQTRLERFFALLDHHELLGDDGFLKPDVGLVSMGDHFDYELPDESAEAVQQAQHHGVQLLSWLARHDPRQVVLLLGNHDICRVAELAFESDESFAEARIQALAATADGAVHARWTHLHIPNPDIARRDFSAFSVAQRALVQRLLLEKRIQLAATALWCGRRVLLTHAAVTTREVELLCVEPDAETLCNALNALLCSRIETVRSCWEEGVSAVLDLAPVHMMGITGQEGGGLLYHRPSNPEHIDGSKWAKNSERPRRFDPRTLPAGLTQICAHTTHKKCVKELGDWVAEGFKRPEGRPRCLRSRGEQVQYSPVLDDWSEEDAALFMVDADMHRVEPADIELLEIEMPVPLGLSRFGL